MPIDQAPTVICPIHNPQGITEIGAGQTPDVISLTLDEAVTLLTQLGFQTTVDWDEPGPLAPGTVYGQDPSAGVPAQTNSTVRLTVAGPAPGSSLPSLLGRSAADAVSMLDEVGIGVTVVTELESDIEAAATRPGAVWKQEPADGDSATSVTIWVNP
jgi:beta-lactam-binding protein with PASTA domain